MKGKQEYRDDFGANYSMNEFLKKMIEISDPNQAIDNLLSFLGEKFKCERTYIFEIDKHRETCSNTYEWCQEGVAPQKDILQNEPLETLQIWWDTFDKNQDIIIPDIEDIKVSEPQLYAGLQPQGITSLVISAIRHKGEVLGFIGIDNPAIAQFQELAKLLSDIGNIISFIMERRNLISRLEYLSFHDKLTGALNRHAFSETVHDVLNVSSLGIVYCDISELKKINDNLGHDVGDELILSWYRIMKESFPNYDIYRIGGDEFVIICKDIPENLFLISISNIKEAICKNIYHMAIGTAWTNEKPISVNVLIQKAEKAMYWDKSNYYNQMNPFSGQSRNRRKNLGNYQHTINPEDTSELGKFLSQNHFDPSVFFHSISMSDYFPFIGDLQSNVFYISDEMKEAFAFQSNLVMDLLGIWEKKILDPEELELYRNDIQKIMNKEKDVHDLRYRVRDKDGNDIWVHSHGIIKWNENKDQPLFFSGGISSQEKNFIVDNVTNFPKEYAAMIKLRELGKKKALVTIIGFTLNNFTEINELRGRKASDNFLKEIAKKLIQSFDGRLSFFRLDGMRFLAIVLPNCEDSVDDLVQELKDTIGSIYYNNNIVVRFPCSIGVICEQGDDFVPQDVLANMTALLNNAKHNPQEDYMMHSQKNLNSQRFKAQMTMELGKNVINGFENFRVVIQPTVNTTDFSIYSGEVLLRWQFNGKDVSPATFIPILENNRLILQVGKWVFEQAVRACKRTISYLPEFKLAVNVSYYQILDPEFLPFMENTLKKYELSGNHLILEITETHYDETPVKVREFIENSKALGMEVAIDDFGDGYSSLAFLIKHPTNIVKLDKSLISEMSNSSDNVNFVSSIVFACHKFGKKVCAEGVETKEEVDMIVNSDCDLIQGYYFFKPMELYDFYGFLPKSQEYKSLQN